MAEKKPKVWVLTREHNDYNQYGEYFVAVFAQQPSVMQMAEALRGHRDAADVMAALALVEHVRAGGGRRGDENDWFNLEQVELR